MAYKIYCKTTDKGIQSYYLTDGRNNYYLLNSDYRKSNMQFFMHGKYIQEVLDAKRHKSASVSRASVRIISAVKYIESEYGICVLHKTAKRQRKKIRSTKLLKRSDRFFNPIAV